jgi:hypothetical protein
MSFAERRRRSHRGDLAMKPSPRDHVAACAGLLASRVPRCAATVLVVAATGAVSIPRPDARLILLAFGIAGQPGHDRLLAAMQPDAAPLEGSPLAPSPRARTAAQALTAWRAAERRVRDLEEHTREWAVARAEVGRVRAEYQRLFAEHQRPIGRYPRANGA